MCFITKSAVFSCLTAFAIAASFSAARAQDFPEGCWKVPVEDGGSVNAIFKCQGNKLCAEVAAPAVDNKKPTKADLGKCVVNRATKTGNMWKGQIYIFAYDVTAEMEMKRKGTNVLDVSGCYGIICSSKDWTKIACPSQRPAHPAKCQ